MKGKTKKRKLFSPDEIATAISQNLNRDLATAEQMYGGTCVSKEFYREAQKLNTLKKYVSPKADMSGVEEETYKAFLETNERMSKVNESFRSPRDIPVGRMSPQERMLQRARALMHWVLGDVSFGEICDHARHSGGVSQGVSFQDTSPEAKFTWPMTGTPKAIQLFRELLTYDTKLYAAIINMNSQTPKLGSMFEEVEGSRATTVPKSNTKLRMIAIEPTLNMFFQQGLMRIMYKRMRGVGLDVGSLPARHIELARRGSLDGKLATIDFSSASDSVSIALLRYLLPEQWYYWVDQVRCEQMKIGSENTLLHMVSTMGNAGTFPLETLVFWCLGVATVMNRTRENPNSVLSLPGDRRKVSVFGDDCILPTVDAACFMQNCRDFGFIVNDEKSFTDDAPGFRESCGGDFFHGEDVRPVFISAPTSNRKSSLEPWLYTILNRIIKKYISYFGPLTYVYEKALLDYLFGLFRKHRLRLKIVPADYPDDAGLQWFEDLQRLTSTYEVVCDPIRINEHGLCKFKYCSFRYKTRTDKYEPVQYAMDLKEAALLNEQRDPSFPFRNLFPGWKVREEPMPTYPRRVKGSYVVASGISSAMSF